MSQLMPGYDPIGPSELAVSAVRYVIGRRQFTAYEEFQEAYEEANAFGTFVVDRRLDWDTGQCDVTGVDFRLEWRAFLDQRATSATPGGRLP